MKSFPAMGFDVEHVTSTLCYWLTDWPPLFVPESPKETAVSQPPLIDLIQLNEASFYLTTHFICIDLWGLVLPDFSVKVHY